MGWDFPWVSSNGNDFNYDFQVTIDEAHPEYNYRPDYYSLPQEKQKGPQKGEAPGMSVFLRDGEHILHTYSTYTRGLDPVPEHVQLAGSHTAWQAGNRRRNAMAAPPRQILEECANGIGDFVVRRAIRREESGRRAVLRRWHGKAVSEFHSLRPKPLRLQ